MKKAYLVLFAVVFAMLLFSTASANNFNDDIMLDSAEIARIAGPYTSRIYKAARWKDGLVATLEGNEVAYFIAGQDEPVKLWRCPTYDYDFFFSTKTIWPEVTMISAWFPAILRFGASTTISRCAWKSIT